MINTFFLYMLVLFEHLKFHHLLNYRYSIKLISLKILINLVLVCAI